MFLLVEAGECGVPSVKNTHVCASTHTHARRHVRSRISWTRVCRCMFIIYGRMHMRMRVCMCVYMCIVWQTCMHTCVSAYPVCVCVLLSTSCVTCTRSRPHARRGGVRRGQGRRRGQGIVHRACPRPPPRSARPAWLLAHFTFCISLPASLPRTWVTFRPFV